MSDGGHPLQSSYTPQTISDLPEELIVLILVTIRQSSSFEESLKFGWLLVCRRWYNIAVNTPHLWNYITLSDNQPKSQTTYLNRALKLSGLLPLDIEIQVEDPDVYSKCLNILMAHSSRWRTCNTSFPAYGIEEDALIIRSTPRLQRLRVWTLGRAYLSFTAVSVALQTLVLENVSLRQSMQGHMFPSLTSLSLLGYAIRDVCPLLSSCPSLRDLCLASVPIYQWNEDLQVLLATVTLDYLAELRVTEVDMEDLLHLLQDVRLPSLKKLMISNLHHLNPRNPSQHLHSGIAHLPALEHLVIHMSDSAQEVSPAFLKLIHDNPTILYLALIGVSEELGQSMLCTSGSKVAVPSLVSLTSDRLYSHFLQTLVVEPRRATLKRIDVDVLRSAGISPYAPRLKEQQNEAAWKWLKLNVEVNLFDGSAARAMRRCKSFATEDLMKPFTGEDATIDRDALWLPPAGELKWYNDWWR